MLYTTYIIVSFLMGLGLGHSFRTKDRKIKTITIILACLWLALGLRLLGYTK